MHLCFYMRKLHEMAKQLCAMERSTVLEHSKGTEIDDRPSVCWGWCGEVNSNEPQSLPIEILPLKMKTFLLIYVYCFELKRMFTDTILYSMDWYCF